MKISSSMPVNQITGINSDCQACNSRPGQINQDTIKLSGEAQFMAQYNKIMAGEEKLMQIEEQIFKQLGISQDQELGIYLGDDGKIRVEGDFKGELETRLNQNSEYVKLFKQLDKEMLAMDRLAGQISYSSLEKALDASDSLIDSEIEKILGAALGESEAELEIEIDEQGKFSVSGEISDKQKKSIEDQLNSNEKLKSETKRNDMLFGMLMDNFENNLD